MFPLIAGNICRSPAAEAVFTAKVKEAGLESKFRIDSCGTGGGSYNWYQDGGYSEHEGDLADGRMTAVGEQEVQGRVTHACRN